MFTKSRISLNRDSLNRSLGSLYLRVLFYFSRSRSLYNAFKRNIFMDQSIGAPLHRNSSKRFKFEINFSTCLRFRSKLFTSLMATNLCQDKKKYNSSFSKGALMENILDGIPPLIYCYINHNENRDLPSIK